MTLESTVPAEDLRMDIMALARALWSRALRILIVTLALMAVTFVGLLFVPRLYESSTSVLVEDRSSTFTQAATGQTSTGSGVTVDALISSQIELIKSRDTLLAVVDSLGLRDIPEFSASSDNVLTPIVSMFGKRGEARSVDELVLQRLNDRLTVIRERDSAVISIFVRSSDPKLAADIANAIAAEHLKRRAGQSVSDTAEASAWLQQQIDELRVKVKEADQKVADFRSEYGIFTGANGTTLPDQQISDIGRQITDAQAVRNAAQQRADMIRSMSTAGQSVDGLDEVRNSAVIQGLMQNRATLQSTLAEKLATLLPAHPTIKALKAQIAQVDRQIAAEARRIADGLEAQVKIQDGVLASLNDDLARAKLAASAQTKDGVTLDSLVREANAQRDLLNAYLIKYRDASGRTDAGSVLPDVRIVSTAAPSAIPASPKTVLIVGAVGFLALALQVGATLFGELMSGRAIMQRPMAFDGDEFAEADLSVFADSDDVADSADMDEQSADKAPVTARETVLQPVSSRQYRAVPPSEDSAAIAFANLSADIALGRERLVMVAAIESARDAAHMTDVLISAALDAGLSVCRVDAGSARPTEQPGLADLCAERASFGDVVHKLGDNFSEVPWGHEPILNRRSIKGQTLVEALTDIYELVVVSCGRVGVSSTMPMFGGVPARVVLVHSAESAHGTVAEAVADVAALGFPRVEGLLLSQVRAAVA